MGGENTDIFAHVAGFGAGCLMGGFFGLLESRVAIRARHQTAAGLAATVLFAAAWVVALQSGG